MNDEDAFLRGMLAAPDDAALRQVYADWLEDLGDPRAEFLRLDADYPDIGDADTPDLRRSRELRASLDPAWTAFVTTLGKPFRTGPADRDFFDCEPARLPFTDTIGRRGHLFTFASQFRDGSSWDASLAADLGVLCGREWGECYYGAGSVSIHPFACELRPKDGPLTGADVLAALKARDFRSRHISTLDATYIPFPGYHPSRGAGTDNDEIHNDFARQFIFRREDEEGVEHIDEFTDEHGILKRAVVDGQLWYVLLHTTPEQHAEFLFSAYVVLFAVGRSLSGDRLIGVVTHQVCHNLCD